jgi:hypothetical protein
MLERLWVVFLQVADALTAPASEIAVLQRIDNLRRTAEQFSGLPGAQFRAADKTHSALELIATGQPERAPIHLQRLVQWKTRQFLGDGSSVTNQG